MVDFWPSLKIEKKKSISASVRVVSIIAILLPLQFAIASIGSWSLTPAAQGAPATFSISTGNPDGKMGMLSRPASVGLETEAADDFNLTSLTTINHASFTGLIPSGTPLTDISPVRLEVYKIFPLDSTNPPSGHVPTRTNSPSDNATVELDSAALDLSFAASVLSSSFSVLNTVVNGINPVPNQHTGGEGAASGEEVLIDVTLNKALILPAGHYFIVPQVKLSTGNFLWLSAPKPIVAPGTPFSPDLQAWIRNANLAPDWLRVGTDIVGGTTPPTFNAAFTLSGFVGTIAYTMTTTPTPAGIFQTSNGAINPSDLVQVQGTDGLFGNFTVTLAKLSGPQGSFAGTVTEPFINGTAFPITFHVTTNVAITTSGTYCWSITVKDLSGNYSPTSRSQSGIECFTVEPPPGSIPAPANCKIAAQPADAISQTTVFVIPSDVQTLTKHAEKELFNCTESGTGDAFTFDVTLYQRITEGPTPEVVTTLPTQIENIAFIQTTCAVDPDTPAKLCQTNPIGHVTDKTVACTERTLAFPQRMDTVETAVSGVVKTIESQKEVFYCSSPGITGTVVEDLTVWTIERDQVNPNGTIAFSTNAYLITDCTKHVADAAQFSTNCETFGPFNLIP